MTEEEQEIQLHEKSITLENSVRWWEEELGKTIRILEEMELLGCHEEEISPFMDQLKYLFAKANFERKEMYRIESQVNKFVVNQSLRKSQCKSIRHKSFSKKKDEQ